VIEPATDIPFTPTITFSQSLLEPSFFGSVFAKPSFWPWRVVAKLIDGIALIEQREIDLFQECTGRTYNRHNRRAVRQLLLLCGRRAGKDRFLSAVGVWCAALACDWRKHLTPGEQGVVILLGADRKQASILRRYCHGLIEMEGVKDKVTRVTNEVIEFNNGSCLEIATNDPRLVRGRSAIAVLGSETCQWRTDEHANANDEEVVSAAENSMGMTPGGGLLILGSSVHRRVGYMYRQYKELFGNDQADDADICWFATSKTMNPKLPQWVIDHALAKNPHKAKADYNNIWREDLSECYPPDVIDASTDFGTYGRPRQHGIFYFAFTDAALGTGKDSFTLCICHCQADGTVVIDMLLERKPRFIPAQVVKEFADVCKSYGITTVQGDKTGGGFHFDEWTRNDITYKPCEFTTSEIYLRALPMFLAGRVRLIDNATLRSQLCSLEHTTTISGQEKIQHPETANAHDDLATAVCGAMAIAGNRTAFITDWGAWVGDGRPEPKPKQTAPAVKQPEPEEDLPPNHRPVLTYQQRLQFERAEKERIEQERKDRDEYLAHSLLRRVRGY
jgi:hypothetical protein